MKEYGHDILDESFSKTEDVFSHEISEAEQISRLHIKDDSKISDFLTLIDTSMQEQAFKTEEIWMDISTISNDRTRQEIADIVSSLWDTDYTASLDKMENALIELEKNSGVSNIKEKIIDVSLNICETRIDAIRLVLLKIESKKTRFAEPAPDLNEHEPNHRKKDQQICPKQRAVAGINSAVVHPGKKQHRRC